MVVDISTFHNFVPVPKVVKYEEQIFHNDRKYFKEKEISGNNILSASVVTRGTGLNRSLQV